MQTRGSLGAVVDLVQKRIIMRGTRVRLRIDPTLPYTLSYIPQVYLVNVNNFHPVLLETCARVSIKHHLLSSSNGLMHTVKLLCASVVDSICLACLTLSVYISWS